MPLNIAGTTIQSSNVAVQIATNSIVGLNFTAGGIPLQSTRPYFIAYVNAGWTDLPSNGWMDIPFNTSTVNNGNHFNTGTYAFTAPVTGVYWFGFNSYGYKPGSSSSAYTHPTFRVNDSYWARNAAASGPLRLRARTYYEGQYSFDQQINDIYNLTAGDYIKAHVYASGGSQYYGVYTTFCGALIG